MTATTLHQAARLFAIAIALSFLGLSAGTAQAQGQPRVYVPQPGAGLPAIPNSNGALVFHGNYCGPGSRGDGLPPVDALDAACMRHDACSPPVGTGLPSCGCNARLSREAALVAQARRTPDDVRVAAQFIAEGARVLACR